MSVGKCSNECCIVECNVQHTLQDVTVYWHFLTVQSHYLLTTNKIYLSEKCTLLHDILCHILGTVTVLTNPL